MKFLGHGTKRIYTTLFYTLFALAVTTAPSYAALPVSECTPGTLGGMICNVINNSMDIHGLITGLGYMFGLILGFNGIMLLKQSVENPNQVPLWEPIKRFVAGGAFFAFPTVMNAAMRTIYKGRSTITTNGGSFNGESSGSGLDAMIVALMSNTFEPMIWAIGWVAWLAGLIFIFLGISRILKSEQQGPAGPTGIGTFATFLTGGALLSMNALVSFLNGTVFGNNMIKSNGVLQYTAGLGDSVGHVHAVISAIIAFAMIIGWVSLVRGVFMVRGVADGSNQASMTAAITHLIGGALAINLGAVINAVQKTLGIDSYGIIFGG